VYHGQLAPVIRTDERCSQHRDLGGLVDRRAAEVVFENADVLVGVNDHPPGEFAGAV
jgi:hypothetical protein